MSTPTAHLRSILSKYPVAEISNLSGLDMATVAGFMDGYNGLDLEDMFKLYGAMIALKSGQKHVPPTECDCPKCTLLRQLAEVIPGAEFKALPSGGGLLSITTVVRSEQEQEPAPRATFLQRIKGIFQ